MPTYSRRDSKEDQDAGFVYKLINTYHHIFRTLDINGLEV